MLTTPKAEKPSKFDHHQPCDAETGSPASLVAGNRNNSIELLKPMADERLKQLRPLAHPTGTRRYPLILSQSTFDKRTKSATSLGTSWTKQSIGEDDTTTAVRISAATMPVVKRPMNAAVVKTRLQKPKQKKGTSYRWVLANMLTMVMIGLYVLRRTGILSQLVSAYAKPMPPPPEPKPVNLMHVELNLGTILIAAILVAASFGFGYGAGKKSSACEGRHSTRLSTKMRMPGCKCQNVHSAH